MNKLLLEPEAPMDGPVFHGILTDNAYIDDDTDFVDDVATPTGTADEEPAWTVDTGFGEFHAPVREEDPAL